MSDISISRLTSAPEIKLKWNTGDDTTKLDADRAMSQNVGEITALTRTIIPYGGTKTVNRLRFTAATANTTERFWQPITGSYSANSEMRSLIYNHGLHAQNTNGQMGHVHRFLMNGSRAWGYIVWYDATLAIDNLLNVDTWYQDSTTAPWGMQQGSGVGSTGGNRGGLFSKGARKVVEILASSKIGTTATYTVPYNHGLIVGEVAGVTATEFNDAVTITAVTANTVTATSATSVANPIVYGGAGLLDIASSLGPFWLASQLVGQTLRAKMWRQGVGEPSWNDDAYTLSYTDPTTNVNGPAAGTIGQCCLYNGHLGLTTSFTEWGEVNWRSLD